MRGGLGKAIVSVSIVLSILAISRLMVATADELLANGGFENGTVGWGWEVGALEVACGSVPVTEGNCAGLFVTNLMGSSFVQYEKPVPVQPGSVYTLTASILKNDQRIQRVELWLIWKDEGGHPLAPELQLPAQKLTQDRPTYQPLSLGTPQSPPNAASASISIRLVSYSSGGQIYIDNVRFEGPPPVPTLTPTPYEPIPTATAISTPLASPTPLQTNTPAVTSTRTPSPTPTATPIPTPPGITTGYLVNGGFEDAIDGVLIGWGKYGGTLRQTSTHQRSGSYAAALSSDTQSTKWAYQPVRVNADRAYEFDGYVLLDDPAVDEVLLRISWYSSDDASGSAIATSDSTERLSGPDPLFRYLTTGAVLVPQGARSAKVRAVLVPASLVRATIYLDDMNLREAPPEAATTPIPPSPATSELDPLEEEPEHDGSMQGGRQSSEVLSQALTVEKSPHQVKINELMYDPLESSDSANNEWIELYNASSETVILDKWMISDNEVSEQIPLLTLSPHSFAVVTTSDEFRNLYPAFNGKLAILDSGRIGNGLANEGDRLVLVDNAGRLVDALSYGEDETVLSPSIDSVPRGHSLERSPPGADTDSARDFVDNPHPSPGTGLGQVAVLAAAQGTETVDDPQPDMEDAADRGSNKFSVWAWGLMGLGVLSLGTILGVSASLYWRRIANRK
jgi:Lamin Tail Domain